MSPARARTAGTGAPRAAGARRDAAAGALPLLEAIPFACAAYGGDGALVAANRRFHDEFGALAGHDRRETLLALLRDGALDDDAEPAEVRAPHSGRWYALHWGQAEHEGHPLALLTAIDISERIEALDSHKSQQEKLLFTSRMMSVGEMAATLAHELNQPLAAIVNYLNGSL